MRTSVDARRHGPFAGCLDAERIAAYADATGDATGTVLRGEAVRAGVQVVAQLDQLDAEGRVAVEQWWTMVLLKVSMADFGTPPEDHRFPDAVRDHVVGSAVHHIDDDVAHRYADVSCDWSAHHFHIDAARASGSDFVFTHGLYTMAVCTHHVLGIIGVDDPGRVRRVAVRFSSPTRLGADLTVNAYAVKGNSFAFEATCEGVRTISHGRLELRP